MKIQQIEKLNAKQLRSYLGISEPTFQIQRLRWNIPELQIGNRIYWLKADVDKWIATYGGNQNDKS